LNIQLLFLRNNLLLKENASARSKMRLERVLNQEKEEDPKKENPNRH
jgi:hypothetical protein